MNIRNTNVVTNISNLHSVDEFTCSGCGVILEDWSRKCFFLDGEEVSYGEMHDDTEYPEYEFRYCPNCGRMIVE